MTEQTTDVTKFRLIITLCTFLCDSSSSFAERDLAAIVFLNDLFTFFKFLVLHLHILKSLLLSQI